MSFLHENPFNSEAICIYVNFEQLSEVMIVLWVLK